MRNIGILTFFGLEAREQALDEASLDTALRAALGTTEVNPKSIMMIPAISSSVSFIAGAIASLPVRLYRQKEDAVEEIKDDYRLQLLNLDTGDLLDAVQWKTAMVKDYIISGGGYALVEWSGTEIKGLYYIEPVYVSAQVCNDHIHKTATFLVDGQEIKSWQMLRILRNSTDGVTGTGMAEEVKLQLETMLNSLQFENHMVRSGGKKGFLKAKNKLTQAVVDQLKSAWRRLYGNNSEENVVVLNDGIEFQDAGQTAVEAQLDENKKTNDHEVYKLSAIVPSILEGGGTKEDRKNTVKFGIGPVAKALENAINRYCLLESEKGSLHFEVDLDALDGTDMLDRYQAYQSAVHTGWLTPEEVRQSEGLNPLGMDFVLLGLDNVIYSPKNKMIYTPNTKEWTEMGEKGGTVNHEN